MEKCAMQSVTSFYAPLWTEEYDKFVSLMEKDRRYRRLEKNEVPQYMLPYITEIYMEDRLYSEFELNREFFPDLCMFDAKLPEESKAALQRIRVACFATGCIFMEFQVGYTGMDLNQIADFSFRFKNANSMERNAAYKVKMIDAIRELIPEEAGAAAFYTSSSVKNDCKMFHQIFMEEELPQEELKRHLVHLSRGYHREFPVPSISDEFDMLFEPYRYDHWAGSQEGLVNIYHLTDNNASNSFLTKYKPIHLAVHYRFMYLILLNQRFSAIVYLGIIPKLRFYTRKEREKMNLKISALKTTFAFSVVSDDQLYQTIYTRMYSIMGIDRLLVDVQDNEEQIELLQNHEILNVEKMTSAFLFGLSVLSLFSVLVDAAGFFDRILPVASVSTVLSTLCLVSIIVFYIIWWVKYQHK